VAICTPYSYTVGLAFAHLVDEAAQRAGKGDDLVEAHALEAGGAGLEEVLRRGIGEPDAVAGLERQQRVRQGLENGGGAEVFGAARQDGGGTAHFVISTCLLLEY
jgi:hypothetical protein